MGILVRQLGMGIGLAAEAIQASREKRNNSVASSSSSTTHSSHHVAVTTRDGPPPYEASEAGTARARNAEQDRKGYEDRDEDEEAWALDDLSADLDGPAPAYSTFEEVTTTTTTTTTTTPTHTPTPTSATSEESRNRDVKRRMRQLVERAGPVPPPGLRRPLERPVILPQRRPHQKTRGFVRAYAPALAGSGIEADVFLQFLEDWQLASQASPWIDAVMLAANVAGFVPEAGAQIASAVVSVAAGTARELQMRHRGNSFLDRANAELFVPRGLFALVVAFRDEFPAESSSFSSSDRPGGLLKGAAGKMVKPQRLNIDQEVAKFWEKQERDPSGSRSDAAKNFKARLRLNAGVTYTELELPPAAELIYPQLDAALAAKTPSPSVASSKWHRSGKFIGDYLDRRAQAVFAAEHAGSPLAVPDGARKPFASRYSDPNHPASNGSLISLLTGGAIEGSEAAKQKRRAAAMAAAAYPPDATDGSDYGSGYGRRRRNSSSSSSGHRRRRRQGPVGMVIEAARNGLARPQESQRTAPSPEEVERREAQQKAMEEAYKQLSRRQKRPGLIMRALRQDVMYLLVVNLPTEAELRESTAQLENAFGEH